MSASMVLEEAEDNPFPAGPHLLETVTPHSDLARIGGVVDDEEDLLAALRLEKHLLIGLMWAPQTMNSAVIAALSGEDAISGEALFLKDEHRFVWATMSDMAGSGMPVTPILVEHQIAERGRRKHLKNFMLDAAAPPDYAAAMPGGIDLPYLAAALVDAWYRRGYRAFNARMSHVIETEPTAHLAGHWASLTVHQQNAERRWLAAHDQFARI